MGGNEEEQWCVPWKGSESDVWVEFKFEDPIELHGIQMRYACDCPERDPVKWKLVVTTPYKQCIEQI